jgi:ArsR family transcriptional regulator, arsenate/arsenite/antimonite-responsive transcriptional repressor
VGSPWRAVADDSRRQMLLLLKDGEKTPTQIAANFQFTFPAVSTHLRVLRDAGLIVERKEGKNRFYSVNFNVVSEMVTFFDGFWNERLTKKKTKP